MEKEIKEIKDTTKTSERMVDTRELYIYLWQKKILILCSAILLGILSIAYSYTLTNEYTAVINLTEVKTDKETSLLNASSEQGFNFSLPGGLGGGNGLTPEVNRAIFLMKSWDFIDEFIKTNSLEVPLLAGIGWDAKSRNLLIDEEKYDLEKGEWKDKNFDINSQSVRWDLYKKFLDELQIRGDKNTGVHQISLTAYSPDLALEWVNKFYKLVNKKTKEKKLRILNNNINNLDKQIGLTSTFLIRERLYDIKAQQIQSKLVIEASPDFVFEPIGETLVPYVRSFPRRTLVVGGITVVGTITFIILLLIYTLITKGTREYLTTR